MDSNKRKWIIFAAYLIIVLIIFIYRTEIEEITVLFLNWIKDNPLLGPLALSLIFSFTTTLCIPGPILIAGAGWAFN